MEYALTVQVNDQLTLDAGTLVADAAEAAQGTVRPPAVPMVEQVLSFLMRQPAEADRELSEAELAQVTTAICLRYGTWFALLSDEARPAVRVPTGTSRIDDAEMARINIEASAALARWLDLRQESPAKFRQLALRALRHLPAQPPPLKRRPRPKNSLTGYALPPEIHLILPIMTMPDVANKVITLTREAQPQLFAARQAEAEAHPTRVLTNALINATWRNGPVESIHAGRALAYPLNSCRISAREREHLLRHTTTELAVALPAIEEMIDAKGRTWPEKTLAFHLLEGFLVTPSKWTLTEAALQMQINAP